MKYLITGNGSFANAMITRLLKTDVKEIRVLSRNEKNQVEGRLLHKDHRVNYIIGDVRDYEAVIEATRGVDYVMHSAALKHIDKCEKFPLEAKKTNIDGSVNVINACIENKVKKLILLSTDKATNATTIYGNTKMFMEMYARCVDNKDTDIICTRYGNVAGSNGSVIPIFKKLKEEKKPLTITDREITRFFMSLDEAVDLVLYALENGRNKDLFVYNNKACTVGEIADAISDNQVVLGLRCTEKSEEALLTVNELNHSILKGNYFKVNEELKAEVNYTEPLTSDNADRFTQEELKALIEQC